ncbi:RHS repeat domain-containing protein, partial [Chondromyces apiculatus]|uniref:RHS repeat domain-containing protein n=1 Tax=Chondromyces apiculatus TaxID=51 RepID=UPI0018CC140F
GTAYYVYDAAGERVRKIWTHNGIIEERLYLGSYEVYRRREGVNADLVLERETFHVMDDARRIAMAETKTVEASIVATSPQSRLRYQFANHLNSASMELDEAGLVISYEEYHPYGTASYHAAKATTEVSQKRYRYTAKERDEETKLCYHGARYCAPWLGKWTAPDPAGIKAGINLYEYALGNPVRLIDPDGRNPLDPNDPNVQRLRKSGVPDQKIQRLINLKPTAPGSSSGPRQPPSGAPKPSPPLAPPPAPPPPAPPGSGRPGDADTPVGPGEHHGAGGKGDGSKEGNGTGTGPGNTLLDFAVFVLGMLGMDAPSDDGVSGGIPGGRGDKENASPAGQVIWVGLQAFWGKAAARLKKLGDAPNPPKIGSKVEKVMNPQAGIASWEGRAMAKVREAHPEPQASCDKLSGYLIDEIGEGKIVQLIPTSDKTPLPLLDGVASKAWWQHTSVVLSDGRVLDTMRNAVYSNVNAWRQSVVGNARNVYTMIEGQVIK